MSETFPHTPLPWSAGRMDSVSFDALGDEGPYKQVYADAVEGTDSGCVVRCFGDEYTCRGNAQLVVRAVNSHDDLLAACELAIPHIQHLLHVFEMNGAESRVADAYSAIEKIQAAIQKARA